MQSIDINEAPVFSPLLRQYTLQEFWELPAPEDRFHYDLIGGFLFMVPPPAPPHDDIDSRLTKWLVAFMLENKIKGEVYHPHAPIYRSAERSTYLEPDMMYVSEGLAKTMGKMRTSADIVFEYASKSTAVYDRTTKADTYLALGVRELWIVDSSTQTIEVRHATSKKERLLWEVVGYSENEFAESNVLAGWKISVTELFEGLTAE